MTAITADMFARTPPFAYAAEALNAIRAQHGRARAAAWARSSEDDITRICAIAVVLENTALAAKPPARPRRGAAVQETSASSQRCAAGSVTY